jgi:hypothetical protein
MLIAAALLAAGCASPGPQSGSEVIAADKRGAATFYDADCYDEFGRPLRSYSPGDHRYGYWASCDRYHPATVYEYRRPAAVPRPRPVDPRRRPDPLPLPGRIGLFPR